MTPEEYARRLWDWTPLNDSFKYGIRLSDLDGIVERRGQFLIVEGKPPGAELSRGQGMLLAALAKLSPFTVVVLRGHPPADVVGWDIVGDGHYVGDMTAFCRFVREWFERIDK